MPVVNALQKVTLTFTSNNLPINQVVTQPLAINIPCADYREAVLLFRVHSFVCVGNVGTPEAQARDPGEGDSEHPHRDHHGLRGPSGSDSQRLSGIAGDL